MQSILKHSLHVCVLLIIVVFGCATIAMAASADEVSHCADWIDVRTFGARGDGVTDDRAAIQKAIEQAPQGGVVYFPSGIYRIVGNIDVARDWMTLAGSGTILFQSNDKPDNRQIKVTGHHIKIKDLRITSTANARTGVYGLVSCFNASDIVLEGLDISKSSSTGIYTMNTDNLRILHCHVHDTWADGIHISRHSRNVIISSCMIRHTGDDGIGIVSYHGPESWNQYPANHTVQIVNNIISKIPARGICASGDYLTIMGNTISDTGKAGIIATHEGWISHHMRIIGNTIHNAGTSKHYGFPKYPSEGGVKSGIYIKYIRDALIADNMIHDCAASAGISVVTSVDVTVRGNDISRCGEGIAAATTEISTHLPDDLLKQLYEGRVAVSNSPGLDYFTATGNAVRLCRRSGMTITGCDKRESRFAVVIDNVLHGNNVVRSKRGIARDIWLERVDHAVVRENVSQDPPSSNGDDPAQGYARCTHIVFQGQPTGMTSRDGN